MEEIIYKKHFKAIILLTLLMIFSYVLIIYIVDPLQYFRKATLYKPIYINELFQNSGIARNFDYDTVIIGSSTSENFDLAMIKKKLGFKAVKLTVAGGSAPEENLMLETAIKTNKVKNVIFGIDAYSVNNDKYRNNLPFYLYKTKNFYNNCQYLFNFGNLDYIYKIITKDGVRSSEQRFEDVYSWEDIAYYSEDTVKKNWEYSKRHLINNRLSFENMRNNFDNYVLKEITNNPQINFILFFPPYSYLFYKQLKLENSFIAYLLLKKHIYKMAQYIPNIKIYDFQTDKIIIENLNNYKDLIHFSKKISDYLVYNLNNKHLVTNANKDKFIKLLEDESNKNLNT